MDPLHNLINDYQENIRTEDLRDFIRNIRNRHVSLSDETDENKNDRTFVLQSVKSYGNNLQYVSDEFKNDRKIVLAAIQDDGTAIQYASEILRNDKEIVLQAISRNANAYKYISEELKNDRQIVLIAFQHGSVFQYIPEELKLDREIVLIAMQQDGTQIQHVPECFQKDRSIVIIAVNQSSQAIKYVSEELKMKKRFMSYFIRRNGMVYVVDKSLFSQYHKKWILKSFAHQDVIEMARNLFELLMQNLQNIDMNIINSQFLKMFLDHIPPEYRDLFMLIREREISILLRLLNYPTRFCTIF